ncbi:hypothetical protein ACKZDW_13315 [Ralstonia syzygii subsp. celebesensis]|uniref:hypothetical protein n=1 Tax=Ralstonia syzygii TaxID=28097 RepID=UPI00387E181C
MKTLYVRTQPKQRIERFFRCGFAFGQDWQKVEVDEATATRLEEEQMLDVTDTRPDDMPEDAEGTAEQSQDDSAKSKPAAKKAGK